jgi:hypothetical protein
MKFLHSNNIIYSDKTFTDGPTHLSSFTAVTNLFSERACVMQLREIGSIICANDVIHLHD